MTLSHSAYRAEPSNPRLSNPNAKLLTSTLDSSGGRVFGLSQGPQKEFGLYSIRSGAILRFSNWERVGGEETRQARQFGGFPVQLPAQNGLQGGQGQLGDCRGDPLS